MNRRGFLKNSIGALLFAGLKSNSVLSQVVNTLNPNSPKILLYLIQTTKGEWKVKATKWIDLYKQKRLKKSIVKPETFKLLDIVDYDTANQRKIELWKQYNCTGRLTTVKIIEDTIAGKKSLTSKNYLDYRNSNRFIETIKKRNEAAAHAIRNMDDELRKYRAETARKYITGRKHDDVTKKKMSEKAKLRPSTMLGKKHSDISKKKMSEKAKGRPSPNKGKTFSQEVRRKMSQSAKQKKLSNEHKQKIKERLLTHNPFRGKKHTKQSLEKIKEKHPSKIKASCVHCKKEFDLANLNRYHGDKCKIFTGVSAVTQEQKIKQSNKRKLQIIKTKKVNLYKYENDYFLGTFNSYKSAANWIDANPECLRLTIHGKRKHSNGYYAKWLKS